MTRLFEYRVEVYLGSSLGWVDITADVRGDVKIKRGRTSEGQRADPAELSIRVANTSGNYSPRNPGGAYYGLLGRNTPIRVSAGRYGATLAGRFYGEVASWPPGWNITGTDRFVDLEAAGILRRLNQGAVPVLSPMRRSFEASDPLEYWPMEEGLSAGYAAAALAGHPPLTIDGPAQFVAVGDYTWGTAEYQTIRFGTGQVIDLKSGAALSAPVPAATTTATTSAWTVAVSGLLDYHYVSGDVVILDVTTAGGTHTRWQVIQRKATLKIEVVATTPGGVSTVVATESGLYTTFMQFDLSVWQNGANVSVTLDTFSGGTGHGATGSVAGTLAGVTSVAVNSGKATTTDTMPFGHLAVWPLSAIPAALVNTYGTNAPYGPVYSMWREPATDRIERLCAESGVPLDMPATASDETDLMGWQPAATLEALLDECADTDCGYLYESRTALGLAYRPRHTLYDQTPVPIAYTGQLAPPFAPDPAADEVRNDVTVKRIEGASARAVQTSGPMAAVPPPGGVGVYQTSVDRSLAYDEQTDDQAGWLLHLGTVDADRFPALSVELAAPAWQSAPAALDALLGVDTGDVLEVTGTPVWAAAEVRTLVLGYTETITAWTWGITFAGVPAQPWDVGSVDGDPRVACDGGQLAAAITSGGLSLSLSTTAANGLWTTDPADFPLELRIGAERVRVSGIAGTASPQTATVTARALNGVSRSWPAGTEVDVWQPLMVAL